MPGRKRPVYAFSTSSVRSSLPTSSPLAPSRIRAAERCGRVGYLLGELLCRPYSQLRRIIGLRRFAPMPATRLGKDYDLFRFHVLVPDGTRLPGPDPGLARALRQRSSMLQARLDKLEALARLAASVFRPSTNAWDR
jgi:hypothetical protein